MRETPAKTGIKTLKAASLGGIFPGENAEGMAVACYSYGDWRLHNPLEPTLALPQAIREGIGGYPALIHKFFNVSDELYGNLIAKCPSLYLNRRMNHDESIHEIRSTFREAIVRALKALAQNMDIATLEIGFPARDGKMIPRTIKDLAECAGMTENRFHRVMSLLRKAGYIQTHKQHFVTLPCGNRKYYPPKRVVSKRLFSALGLEEDLAESQAYKKQTEKPAIVSTKDKAKRKQNLNNLADIYGALKHGASKRKFSNKKQDDQQESSAARSRRRRSQNFTALTQRYPNKSVQEIKEMLEIYDQRGITLPKS